MKSNHLFNVTQQIEGGVRIEAGWSGWVFGNDIGAGLWKLSKERAIRRGKMIISSMRTVFRVF